MNNKKMIFLCVVMCVNFFTTNIAYAYENNNCLINGISINKQLININYTKGVEIKPKYIVIHDTDNRAKGANAQANRDFFANHKDAKVSAHYVVDDSNIVQVLEDNWLGWHSGEVRNNKMNNKNSIAIEMCVNEDNDFGKTFENTVELTKHLMKKYHISKENVIRHNDVTGKTCPKMMIVDRPNLWGEFKEQIGQENKTDGNKSSDEISVEEIKNKTEINGKIRNISTLLNIRREANTSREVIDCVENGQNVQVIQHLDNWYKIRYIKDSLEIEGYVRDKYVLCTENYDVNY
ncbi:N-acetylmuramoyl-L-alanine amidase [Clostridium frigidicarnis]|uniref:N-acetylmuramoyl-L-alanine amidase n=1 Tax=Clostridium frigidicarnis TaxID=84698 RepID=A0A1I0VJA6_9CLOT|nr:N-acetylmuramoyl-L-alanine amidase [Clostridium frigidicarnis]SFA76103.1 N-acetylmuramoyl-L-alanine amidase CwlA [Clostridium frigidicarnis]